MIRLGANRIPRFEVQQQQRRRRRIGGSLVAVEGDPHPVLASGLDLGEASGGMWALAAVSADPRHDLNAGAAGEHDR